MRRRTTLSCLLLLGGLTGCGASASKAAVDAAEAQARSARADATREHVRLVQLEARLREMEHRLVNQAHACKGTPEPQSVDVAGARPQPATDPARSEGDFQAEARAVALAPAPPAAKVAVGVSPPAVSPASEHERLEQLLEGLRAYGFDSQSGLSLERREALRVLLRRERQLDLMNPWGDH